MVPHSNKPPEGQRLGYWRASGGSSLETFKSSYQTDPDTSCSEADRAASTRRSSCALHCVSGTENEKPKSVHFGATPTNIGPCPNGDDGLSAQAIYHCSPRGPRSSPLNLPAS